MATVHESSAAADHESVAPSQHLAAIVASSDDAILSKDRAGTITSWNQAAERIYGYSAAEAIGRPISILIPAHRGGEERRILDQVLAGDPVDHYETERRCKDGRIITVSLTVSPIRDSRREIVGASVIARDVTEKRRVLQLAEHLREATAALSRALTPSEVVDVTLEHSLGTLDAQAGSIVFTEGGEAVLAGSIGFPSEVLDGWDRFPLEDDLPITEVIRTGVPIWDLNADEVGERFPQMASTRMTFPSAVVLPMIAGGIVFGSLALSFGDRRELDPSERAFLAAVTQQAAYAVSRASLYEDEHRAATRQAFLTVAGDLLAESLDPELTLTRLAELIVRHIADWCAVTIAPAGGIPLTVAAQHVDPGMQAIAEELVQRYPIGPDSESGPSKVIRTGVSELLETVTDERLVAGARDGYHLELLRRLEIRSSMVVPLRARARVVGAITLVSSDPERRYGRKDLVVGEELGRRAGLAIDNAMLYRREHEAALILQRSLLPDRLPQVPGIELEARYEPAAPGLEVGGDWYEVVEVDDGSLSLTIADVAGRGIHAASVMARLRPTLAAYVREGHAPGEALRRLDRAMQELDPPQMATIFHLQYDPERKTARYVRAGHPPALLLLPDGSIDELGGRGTPPLGILKDVEVREHEVEIPDGSLLLLYTDGLIERRGADLLVGLQRLSRAVRESGPTGAGECLDRLMRDLVDDPAPDDVAMLAMRT